MGTAEFQAAVKDVAEIFMFEYWLRFYFLREEGDDFVLDVPEEEMARIKSEHPNLAGLAEMMDKTKMDMTASRQNVCAYAGSRLDGGRYPAGIVSEVLDSKSFKLAMYVFSLWLKGHEGYLDEHPQAFTGFLGLFTEWHETDEVREYMKKLDASGPEPRGPADPTVH